MASWGVVDLQGRLEMPREKYNPNIYRGLTPDIKEKLRVAILGAVLRVLREQRRITHPPLELIIEFISVDVRRIVEQLSEGLVNRQVYKQYFIMYKGPGGKKAFKLIKCNVPNMSALKQVVEFNRPDWASKSETYPLARMLPDDDYFPYTCFWPKVEPYKRTSHASV